MCIIRQVFGKENPDVFIGVVCVLGDFSSCYICADGGCVSVANFKLGSVRDEVCHFVVKASVSLK